MNVIEAARMGDIDMVRLLLQYDPQLDLRDNDGNTALMQASLWDYTDIVDLLLQKGAQIDLQDNMGRTALMQASRGGYADIVKLLLQNGAKVTQAEYDRLPVYYTQMVDAYNEQLLFENVAWNRVMGNNDFSNATRRQFLRSPKRYRQKPTNYNIVKDKDIDKKKCTIL